MTYRDNEIGKLKSELKGVSERLAAMEQLVSERGLTKTFARKIVEGIWSGITWPFRLVWTILTSKTFYIIAAGLTMFAGIGMLYQQKDARDRANELARAEQNAIAIREERLAKEAEIAAAAEAAEQAAQAEREAEEEAANAEQRERDAARQALLDQCSMFCKTHGYSFQEDRRDDLCFCTQGNSERTAFIINVETSENWVIRSEHR